ncbi:acyl carrier protein [Nannocystis pusilla]|uniref:Acyl carrier protein n=1 Tax=Nannocystis pusilla TaxID=889268 RepID=A0A9X3ELP9_9BACT|nr:acyl carrier protein [Nannocystis pusilla]MCY1006364.1 acyl carrier protein [Nannocystis pusilla]
MTNVQEVVTQQFAALVDMPADRIDQDAPLGAYGMTSILAVQLLGKLEKECNVALSLEELTSVGTLNDLGALVSRKLAESPGA